MSRTSFVGYLRQYGSNKKSTPAVFEAVLQFTFDPTAASASTGTTLPRGAIPIGVRNISGGATGGTNPTVDIGISGNGDGFAEELDADAVGGEVNTGALLGIELTVDTPIFAGVGASAATGGSVLAAVKYIMPDDGEHGNN